MKAFIPLIIAVFCSFFQEAFSQDKARYTVNGYVRDKETGEALPGASIYLKETTEGTTSNNYGFYSLTAPAGSYILVFSYLGYAIVETPLVLKKNQTVTIELQAEAILTQTIEISDERKGENLENTEIGQIELRVEDAKKLPVIFGEVDVLKTIQLLPGVKGAGEGNAGFYVRGGGPDQNLILLDNAVVYNPSHLFGFFSVFNSDAIRTVNLIKGGMPANYGGRLSSVLDIAMKEGNMKKFHGDGGVGLIASRLTLQGPIKKDKASFLVAARRTYFDVLVRPFIKEGSRLFGNSYYFLDLNAKINWRVGKNDRIFVSGYYGEDVFNFKSPTSDLRIDIPWGNGIGSIRWTHTFGSRVFLNVTGTFTDYKFETGADNEDFSFRLFSGIRDYGIKADMDWLPNTNHSFKFGADYVFHEFTPSTASARFGESLIEPQKPQKYYAHDAAVYALDEFNLGSRVKVNAGLRFSYFQHTGPFDRYLKDGNGNSVDTISYKQFERVSDYARVEPRLSMRIKITERFAIKLAFTQNYQNLHLANLATVSLPTDIWLPSTEIIPPQKATQYNIGFFRNFFDNMLETSIEAYYKDMTNLVEYRDNSSLTDVVNDNPDNIMAIGNGRSFGMELFVKKRFGKITGWIGYTLAWTQRLDFNKNEVSYDGDFFYPRYDRRHDLAFTLTWDVHKRWTPLYNLCLQHR
jgi:hypothetical protein